jgi:type IV secretion system protein VirD4
MVSRQETARPLLTPGEVMQLPASDELVLVSGLAPIRASKLRYFEDRNFTPRLLAAPSLSGTDAPAPRPHNWADCVRPADTRLGAEAGASDATGDGGLQQARQPDLAPGQRARPESGQLDLLGRGEDEADGADAGLAMRALSPVLAAHAANQGSARGDDLMPSF